MLNTLIVIICLLFILHECFAVGTYAILYLHHSLIEEKILIFIEVAQFVIRLAWYFTQIIILFKYGEV